MAKIHDTLAQDGLRVNLEVMPDQVDVLLQLFLDGEVSSSHRLRSFEVRSADPAAAVPEICRFTKMASAIARFLNEGGDLHDAFSVFDIIQGLGIDVSCSLELVSVEAEETHVRTYRTDDGNFIRIIEDEVAEELTPEEMLAFTTESGNEL